MAEGDDDESFGDFTFASFPSSNPNPKTSINFPNFTSSGTDNNEDDDDWGDFVEYPLQSNPHTAPQSQPLDSSGSFPSNTSQSHRPLSLSTSLSLPGRVEPTVKPNWVKLSGALPLSIFGDVEEEEVKEEEKSVGVAVSAQSNGVKVVFGHGIKSSNGLNPLEGIGSRSLYNYNQNIKVENGSVSNSSGLNFDLGALVSSKDELNSSLGSDLLKKDVGNVTNLSDQDQQEKTENRVDLGFNELALNLSRSSSSFGNWNAGFGGLSSNLNGLNANATTSLNSQGQNAKVDNNGINSNGPDLKSSAPNLSFGGWDFGFSEPVSSPNAGNSNVNGSSSNLDLFGGNGVLNGDNDDDDDDDDDDDGWEFKDAFSELKVEVENDKAEPTIHDFPKENAKSFESTDLSNGSINLFSNSNGLIDLFANSNGISSDSNIHGKIVSHTELHISTQNDSIPDQLPSNELGDGNGVSDSYLVDEAAESDEDFGDFTAAFTETRQKGEGELKDNDWPSPKIEALEIDSKDQMKGVRLENHNGEIPLSIFGKEELERESSWTVQDAFTQQQISFRGKSQIQNPVVSINDLISNLYSQAGQISQSGNVEQSIETTPHYSGTMSSANLTNGVDDFDDSSWEFKDAFSGESVEKETSFRSHDDTDLSSSTAKPNNYIDFYSKLKDALSVLLRGHLENLKKAGSVVDFSSEGTKMVALDEEIQEAQKQLAQENAFMIEDPLQQCTPSNISLNEFLRALQDPKFQVLDAEYQLSRKLSLVEKNLKSAVELMKHASTMLKMLTFVSPEQQSTYVSTWLKMISVCAEELQHGSWIWKQILDKNAKDQIFSESRGKKYILALGEIYRVVLILEASIKLYKPWSLSNSEEFDSIHVLLDECHSIWSTSGLEEALSMVINLTSADDSTWASLLDFIKNISLLDALTLENHVLTPEKVICHMSLLASHAVPGLKMVIWNGDQYFLTLANLWANLISSDPPKLPSLHLG